MKFSAKQIILYAVVISTIVFTSCVAPKNATKPSGTITKEQANLLEDTYITNRWETINENIGYADSREFVFELDRLKQYIAYVEAQAKAKGYSDLGLRVYLGTYPEGFNNNDKKLTTVFFIPAAKHKKDSTDSTNYNSSKETKKEGDEDDSYDNIEDIDGLNFGHAGMPPKNYD